MRRIRKIVAAAKVMYSAAQRSGCLDRILVYLVQRQEVKKTIEVPSISEKLDVELPG
jgi:hypothetical protein